jgi:arabinan endo-1,5-alpha-L-arabinosidase
MKYFIRTFILILFLLTTAFNNLPTIQQGVTPTPQPTLSPDLFRNPVLDRDFPDPDVLQVGDTYYAYATNSDDINIQVAQSIDLVNWEFIGEALPILPDWAVQDFGWVWAPDVSVTDDGYLMYFTARFAIEDSGSQCVGAATSNSPTGPFESVGDEPFICQVSLGGSIDPSSFVDEDGTRYVLWKNDGNCCGGQTWIYIQQTSEDGLTLEGEPTRLITADEVWEGVLVEAPTLLQYEEQYFLFYSANDYLSTNYAIGYAVADTILGPYVKPESLPFLETSIPDGIVSPGGQDIVLDAEGDTWMVYHTWASGSYRPMNLITLQWINDVPLIEPSREPQPVP